MTDAQPQVIALGVYRWPFTDGDVIALGEWLYRNPSPANLQAAREQLAALVVVELRVASGAAHLALDGVSQTPPDQRNGNEQAPYDESWWNDAGETLIDRGYRPAVSAPCRVVYFLHFFDPAQPLYTAAGAAVALPPISALPARLASVLKYEAP